jgi:outer membrane lipopolysaccharide assembly protein LptE/RlpB
MKKVFLLLIVLVLTACDNPFKKYEESFDALTAAVSLGKEVENVQEILDTIDTANVTITEQQIGELLDSLTIIKENLDNPQVQAILTSYIEKYEVPLDVDATAIQNELQTLQEFIAYPNVVQKEQALNLISDILDELTP